MILFGVSGKRGSGKDTLADILVEKYKFIKMSFAEELKKEVREKFGLTKEHTDCKLKEKPLENFIRDKYKDFKNNIITEYWTPRQIMIHYGQFFRQFDLLWWTKKVFNKIKDLENMLKLSTNYSDLRVVISDVRFKNEANYIRQHKGKIIRLERKPDLNIYGPEQLNDISETDMDNYLPDYLLDKTQNINKDDLYDFAEHIIKKELNSVIK